MRCRALALIGLLAAGVVVACQATPPCTPAGCPDRFSARFEVEPSIFVLNGGSMSLCRGEVCVTARIRFDDLDGGFPLSVNCPVRPPPTIAGPTVDCGNELIEPSKENYVENVILIEYRAPQQATPIEMDIFTIRLTNGAGDVVAERNGSPIFAMPNPPAASCNPYCTEGTL